MSALFQPNLPDCKIDAVRYFVGQLALSASETRVYMRSSDVELTFELFASIERLK